MAFLAHCWLFVESFIIPHGFFLKWFYLSFYIHPLFLLLLHLFLCLKKLLQLLYFPYRIVCCTASFVIGLTVSVVFPVRVEEVFHDAMEPEPEPGQRTLPGCDAAIATHQVEAPGFQTGHMFERDACGSAPERDCLNDSWLNEYLCSERYVDPYLLSYGIEDTDESDPFSSDDEPTMEFSQYDRDSNISPSEHSCDSLVNNVHFPTGFSPDSPVRAMEQCPISHNIRENKDSFHQKLTQRFKFFNLLYNERLHGLREISNEHLISPVTGSTAEQIRTKIRRSLENDFELIYVAQTALFWEALYRQYRHVEVLTLSETRIFHHSVSGKFQEFQVLLERFVEGQKFRPQRCANYIYERLSFHCTIQVPDIAEFTLQECNGAEAIGSNEVTKAIKKCMEAFWTYIRTDEKPLWKHKGSFQRTSPPVEDPVDLELLYHVTEALQKQGAMMKDLHRKRGCWLQRKVEPELTEVGRINLLFARIEMKLVERVLKMALVSGSQLKWCLEKLGGLEFTQGEVFRNPTSNLFPCS